MSPFRYLTCYGTFEHGLYIKGDLHEISKNIQLFKK